MPAAAQPSAGEIEAERSAAAIDIAKLDHPAPATASKHEEPSDPSTYFIDTAVHTTTPFFGCPQQEGLDRIKAMLRANDGEAMVKAALKDGCTAVGAGTRGTVEDHSVWHASTCLRQRGEPDCMWLPDPVITKD